MDSGGAAFDSLKLAGAPAKPLRHVVAVALVDRDGRVLLTERPAGKHLAGHWEFPGGKIEPGETPERALIRELAEELGISVTASCLAPAAFASHDYESFHLILLLYVCRKWDGEPQSLEGQALRWEHVPRMFALPMPPADRPLLGLLDALI